MLTSNYPGVLLSDCLSTYDDATEHQQKCYYHHFQAIREARGAHPQGGIGYLDQLSALLRTTLLLKHLEADAEPLPFQTCVRALEARAQTLLSPPRPQPQEQ